MGDRGDPLGTEGTHMGQGSVGLDPMVGPSLVTSLPWPCHEAPVGEIASTGDRGTRAGHTETNPAWEERGDRRSSRSSRGYCATFTQVVPPCSCSCAQGRHHHQVVVDCVPVSLHPRARPPCPRCVPPPFLRELPPDPTQETFPDASHSSQALALAERPKGQNLPQNLP